MKEIKRRSPNIFHQNLDLLGDHFRVQLNGIYVAISEMEGGPDVVADLSRNGLRGAGSLDFLQTVEWSLVGQTEANLPVEDGDVIQ
jgi:hypothetical protein